MRHTSSQRATRKPKRRHDGTMGGFQPGGMLPSLSQYTPRQIFHDPSTPTPFATTFNGGLPSTPTLNSGPPGTVAYPSSYHPSTAGGGTPTTPSAPPSMGLTQPLQAIGHGMSGALLRPTTATLHTTAVPPLSNHLSGGFGGMPPPRPSVSNHQQQQPSALISSPMNDRIHLNLSVPRQPPPPLNSGGPGSVGLGTSLPHLGGTPRVAPPPPPHPMPSIPLPGIASLVTTPTGPLEAGTPTGAIPPLLSGPGALHTHASSQQFVAIPQTNYQQQDRIPFELDFPPHGLYFRILLDAKLVGGLIGKKGQSIEHIRKTSGAKIHIAKKLPNQQPIMRLVTVSGTDKQVIDALQMIADKVASAQQDGSGTTSNGEAGHHITLLVDEKNVGCLIGKNGNTINNIRKKTGANVFISSHPMPQSSEKSIDVGGSKDSVDAALEAICNQFISNPKYVPTRNKYNPQASLFPNYMYPMHLFGNQGIGRGDLVDASSAIFPGSPPNQTQTVQYRVEKNHIGGIIGRGGRNIAEIRRQSQATVTIDNDQSNGTRTVTLRGSQSEIALAVQLLRHAIVINQRDSRETRS